MELRWLVRKGTYPPDARGDTSEWEEEPILEYRTTKHELIDGTHEEYSEWKQIPIVILNTDNDSTVP